MRKLFLHVGCGKTGSSALQIWLANNAGTLNEEGIIYSLSNELDDYEITSGNGVHLLGSLKNGELEKFLKTHVIKQEGHVLFSSEAFQNLTHEEALELKKCATRYSLDIHIIAYVRDVYDVAYSGYLQLLKRHSYTNTFREYSMLLENIQQFEVVSFYKSHFENLHVIHYDSEKERGIEKSFCEVIGLNSSNIPEMPKKKVNRSLTVRESELMRVVNSLFLEDPLSLRDAICLHISDSLIKLNPEIETEILYIPDIEEYLYLIMGSKIEAINSDFFKRNTLNVFNPNNKVLVRNLVGIPYETYNFLKIIIGIFKNSSLFDNELGSGISPVTKLNKYDSRIPDILREEGMRNENNDKAINDSIKFIDPAPAEYLEKSRINKAEGRLDGITNQRKIFGWARYVYKKEPAIVNIYINKTHIGTVIADQERDDLRKKFNEACAYYFNIPESVDINRNDLITARVESEIRDLDHSPLIIES